MNNVTFAGLGTIGCGLFMIVSDLLNLPVDAGTGLAAIIIGGFALFIGKTR